MVTKYTDSLSFNNSTFCPHSVFMCFVWISEQTAIISLYNINWPVCITETECVYCAVRTAVHIPALTAKAWIRFQFSPHEMCGAQSDTGTVFQFPPRQYYSTNARFSSPTCCSHQDERAKPGNLRKSHKLPKIGKHLTYKCWHLQFRALKTAYTCTVSRLIANNQL